MRIGFTDPTGESRPALVRPNGSGRLSEEIPLYDVNQFACLIERERARADRAKAKAPHGVSKRHQAAAKSPAPELVAAIATAGQNAPQKASGGQPKPSSEGVWGATTNNREFTLVVFRPTTRRDRGGLVELLQSIVRSTDAVGIIDNRRLGVLLPDTSAENALHFVKKVLTQATEQSVQITHVMHTYPHSWPDDDAGNSVWKDPLTASEPKDGVVRIPELRRVRPQSRGLVAWLQAVPAALRRPSRSVARARA